jgi:hypothetical protein
MCLKVLRGFYIEFCRLDGIDGYFHHAISHSFRGGDLRWFKTLGVRKGSFSIK